MSRKVNRSKKRKRVVAKKKRVLKRRCENAGKVIFAYQFEAEDGFSVNSKLLELLNKQSCNPNVKVTGPGAAKAKLLGDILAALNTSTRV